MDKDGCFYCVLFHRTQCRSRSFSLEQLPIHTPTQLLSPRLGVLVLQMALYVLQLALWQTHSPAKEVVRG